ALQDGVVESFDIKLLISCARSTDDATTLNHVLVVISSFKGYARQNLGPHT
nr:hypothetical protein [Tanacetum cinerariifolium]